MRTSITTKPKRLVTVLTVGFFAFSLWAAADGRDPRAREAGPEDGALCCTGVGRFLFYGDSVLVTTGRAGIFGSDHRGADWQRSMKGLVGPDGVSPFVAFVCQAPSAPRVVYALTGLGSSFSDLGGLFTSADFGKTWKRRASVPTGFGFGTCGVDPEDPRTVYVSIANLDENFDVVTEVWKSTDGGRTVQPIVLPDVANWSLRVALGAVYLTDDARGAYASTDGGTSFHPVPTPPGFVGDLYASPDGRLIFLETSNEAFGPIRTFRSADGGATWIVVSGLPNGIGIPAFHPADPSRIYASDGLGLLRVSIDGGLSFTLLPASNDPRFLGPIREIDVDARGSIFLSSRGGPFRSDDGGQTFRSMLNGFRASAVQDLSFDADGKLLVGVLNTQFVFRQTRGRCFLPIGNRPLIDMNSFFQATAAVAGSPTDPSVILTVVDGQGLFRTENGGRSWELAEVPATRFVNARVAFATASRVYLVSPSLIGMGLYRSDDAGRTFASLSTLPFGAIAVDPTDPDVFYVGDYRGSAGLFKSTDGGETLEDLGQPGTFGALAVDRRDTNVIYAGERFGQVLRSRDGGYSFVPASTGLLGAGVHGLVQDARGTLFVWLRGGGLFSSDDGASSWTPVDTGEALHRSGVDFGRGTLLADPRRPGRLYLGNAGVLQVDAAESRRRPR
jgi:photosystem II stability/assembly factor-like uncharacterized protein